MHDINDSTEFDEQDRCRSADCDGDPNNGDGWDGYCADIRFPPDVKAAHH